MRGEQAADNEQQADSLREHMSDPPKVVVITTLNNDDYVYEALRAGVAGFLLKRDRPAQIAHAIRLVASGDSILFPDAVRRLVTTRPQRPGRPGVPALTTRETEVPRLMAAGLTNHDIAATPGDRSGDGQDPRHQPVRQTWRAKPHPSGDPCLRVRHRGPGDTPRNQLR